MVVGVSYPHDMAPTTTTISKEETMTVTPKVRFTAAAFANGLAYEGAHNLRVTIDTAAKVEAFPTSYSADEVTAAKAVLITAAHVADTAEDHDALDLARRLFWTTRGEA